MALGFSASGLLDYLLNSLDDELWLFSLDVMTARRGQNVFGFRQLFHQVPMTV